MKNSDKSDQSSSRAQVRIRIVTPAQILMHLYIIALVIVLAGSTLTGLAENLDRGKKHLSINELERQLRAIRRRLNCGEDALQVFIVPEGPFLANVFHGYSLVNMALQFPENEAFRKNTVAELAQLIRRLKSFRDSVPFSATDRAFPGGIIYNGNLNRLLAGYILIGGKDGQLIEDFHAGSQIISRAFQQAHPPFPESFTGLTWPVDGIAALDSLRLHDELFGTDYAAAKTRWLTWLKNHRDPQTQLIITQAGKGGNQIVDGTRGCAMSWMLALLPGLDKNFAQEQYDIFRRQWFVHFGPGLLGIREWYQGVERASDFKPGPVIFGLGAAATGFGIAATRANADCQSWHEILDTLEILGFPYRSAYGETTYFCGQTLLCDTIALWGKTIVPWQVNGQVAERQEQLPPASAKITANSSAGLIAIVAALATILIAVPACLIKTLVQDSTAERPKLNPVTAAAAAAQIVLAIVWFLTPLLAWMQVLIIMAIVSLIEEMILRPPIVARIFRQRN
jgi:hypothetical protein